MLQECCTEKLSGENEAWEHWLTKCQACSVLRYVAVNTVLSGYTLGDLYHSLLAMARYSEGKG